jgi:hypothetical protein
MGMGAVDLFVEGTVAEGEVAVAATRREVVTHTEVETVEGEAAEAVIVADIEVAEDKEEAVVVVVATEND